MYLLLYSLVNNDIGMTIYDFLCHFYYKSIFTYTLLPPEQDIFELWNVRNSVQGYIYDTFHNESENHVFSIQMMIVVYSYTTIICIL